MAKHDYDRAMYRMTTIISRLNIGERLFLSDLAQEFGVTVRTIQKDFSTRLSTFPIIKNDDGSYSFMQGYRLKGTPNHDESTVIELMGALTEQVNTDYSGIVSRLLKGAGYSNRTFAIHLNFEDISEYLDIFYLLKQSINFRQKLQFDYTTKHGDQKTYLADPYRLGNFQGFWYLIALDHAAGILKTFYLKNIQNIRVSPENYTIDPAKEKEIEQTYGDFNTAWFKEGKNKVRLVATGDAKRYLLRNPGPAMTIIKQDKDSLHLEMTYHREVEVMCLVKHWIPDVRIVGNEALTRRLREELNGYVELLK